MSDFLENPGHLLSVVYVNKKEESKYYCQILALLVQQEL